MNIKNIKLHKSLFKLIVNVLVRVVLLSIFLALSMDFSFTKVYNLAILYISFLVIIINIKHKYLLKIMNQSFILMVLGVLMYLIQVNWINTYIRAFVELLFLITFIELAITTLNFKEVWKILRVSFGKFEGE